MFKEIYVAHTDNTNINKQSRCSNSTAATENSRMSDLEDSAQPFFLSRRQDPRIEIFKSLKFQGEISHKLIEKSICWIQVFGYTKDLQFETVFLAISLFYAAIGLIQADRKRVEAIICACIFLASKMNGRTRMKLGEILLFVDNRQRAETILEQQKNILNALDYNLQFSFPLLEALNSEILKQEEENKVKLITEILLIKQCSSIHEMERIQQIVQQGRKKKIEGKVGVKVQKIMKKNNCQHLLNKYQSKFDVLSFISD